MLDADRAEPVVSVAWQCLVQRSSCLCVRGRKKGREKERKGIEVATSVPRDSQVSVLGIQDIGIPVMERG